MTDRTVNATKVTVGFLFERYSADFETGKIYSAKTGREIFTCKDRYGYFKTWVPAGNLVAHRVLWALAYGEWPDGPLDHINGDRSDNRLANLRIVSVGENNRNKGLTRKNKSGVVGVSWHSRDKIWRATIGIDGKRTSLGDFKNIDDAKSARAKAEIEAGYHPLHGIRTAVERPAKSCADDDQQETVWGLAGGLEKPGKTTTLKTKENINGNGAPTKNQSDKSRP